MANFSFEVCGKQTRKFASKFRRCRTNLVVHPLGLAENKDFARFCPNFAVFRLGVSSTLPDTLPPQTFVEDLVNLSEVDRIFNVGTVGPCSTLNQYGYGGKISSGQWACLSVSSKAKMQVTEKMGQKFCCHKHMKTEL